jgi:hypothetical protein
MTKLTNDQLGSRVRAALQDQAARLQIPETAFDPARPVRSGLPPAPKAAHPGRLLATAAAAVILLAGGLTFAFVRHDSRPPQHQVRAGQPRSRTTPATGPSTTSTTAPPAQVTVPGAVAPSADITGLQLWSATWGPSPPAMNPKTQLFGRVDGTGGRVLMVIGPSLPGATGGGTGVTVRGQQGQEAPAKVEPQTNTTITWQETASIDATYQGMTQDQALGFLATLQWKSNDHQAGFTPGPSSGLQLLGDADPGPSNAVTARFRYADTPSALALQTGRQLDVRTTTGSGQISGAYLDAWYHGTRNPDGTVSSYDPSFKTLTEARPDGSTVWADANRTDVAKQDIERMVASLQPRTGDQMLALRNQIDDRLQALPTLGSATLDQWTVSLRGDPEAPTICLLTSTGHRCAAPDGDAALSLDSSPKQRWASFVIDGHWYVVVIGDPDLNITGPTTGRPGTTGALLPSKTATIGSEHVVVCEPDNNLQQVNAGSPTQSAGITRPSY